MSTAIEKVTGIGPQTAALLASHGIHCAEDLAARRVGDLAAIKGFSVVRAGQVIEVAKQLIGAPEADDPAEAAPSAKKDKDKQDKKKKKKNSQEKAAKSEKTKSSSKKGKDKKGSVKFKKKGKKKK